MITIDRKKNEITIVVPMFKSPVPSTSGKNLLLASANTVTTEVVDGQPVRVNCNVYYKNTVKE